MLKNTAAFLGIYFISFLVSVVYYFSDSYLACQAKMASGAQTLCFVDVMMWWLMECIIFIPWLLISLFFILKKHLKVRYPKSIAGLLAITVGLVLWYFITYVPLPSTIAGLIFGVR